MATRPDEEPGAAVRSSAGPARRSALHAAAPRCTGAPPVPPPQGEGNREAVEEAIGRSWSYDMRERAVERGAPSDGSTGEWNPVTLFGPGNTYRRRSGSGRRDVCNHCLSESCACRMRCHRPIQEHRREPIRVSASLSGGDMRASNHLAFTEPKAAAKFPVNAATVAADIDALLAGFGLQKLRRFAGQIHWERETRRARIAGSFEGELRLESVAAHSWHVADAALLVGANFGELDLGKVAMLAVLHDKLELFTGDFDPVGPDGRGCQSHAFNAAANEEKQRAELNALDHYLGQLGPHAASVQRDLMLDILYVKSSEAALVKAIDKLQALAYVHSKKSGRLTDEHVAFTIKYSRKCVEAYPQIEAHYLELLGRFLRRICECRGVTLHALRDRLLASYPGYL